MSAPLILLSQEDKVLVLLYQNNRLVQADAYPQEGSDRESIYIGKVKNVVPSLDAAFVEYRPGKMGFLPLKKHIVPVITNRVYDGRIVSGDEILVQVEKEEMKAKSAGLTCNLSFTGRYSVITSARSGLGYSSKLSAKQKACLSSALLQDGFIQSWENRPEGLILRTNSAQLQDMQPLKLEAEALLAKKERIYQEAFCRTCFSCLYQPPPVWISAIRDQYDFSYDRILTDDERLFNELRASFSENIPLSLYQDGRISLDRLYNVKTRLEEALSRKVWLKSGAHLIIQPTEALTVIDVNSGKMQKKKPGDDLYYQINREAAREIALQLKLRNLSGIIIVDFISQHSPDLDKQLLQEFREFLRKDPVQTTLIDMTPLGLVEITRKKIKKPLSEQLRN